MQEIALRVRTSIQDLDLDGGGWGRDRNLILKGGLPDRKRNNFLKDWAARSDQTIALYIAVNQRDEKMTENILKFSC